MFVDYKLWSSRILGAKAYYQAYFMIISFNTPVRGMGTTPDMHLDKIYTYLKCVPILLNKQLLIQWLFSGTISLLIQKISMPSTSQNIWNFISVWTTFWKLVIFLYAPFSNLMYISHSLNSFFSLKSPKKHNTWRLTRKSLVTFYFIFRFHWHKTVTVRVNNVVVVRISNWSVFLLV